MSVLAVTLLAVAALAIDIPFGMAEKRAAQNAADHAALSASFAKCGGAVPEDAADAAVVRNGYAAEDLTLSNPSGNVYQATVQTGSQTFFAGILGRDTLGVSATAEADCTTSTTSGDNYSIYALGETCDKDFDVSGQKLSITGRVHSNGIVYVGSSDNIFNDEVTFGTEDGTQEYKVSENTYDYTEGKPFLADPGPPAPSYPLTDYFNPGTGQWGPIAQAYSGHKQISNGDIDVTKDGFYATPGKITVKEDNPNLKVTLTAGGGIEFPPGLLTLEAADTVNNIVAYSYENNPCSPVAKVNGSENTITGTFYAPNGQVELSGQGITFTGAMVGHSIKLNGSDHVIRGDLPLASQESDPELRLTR